MQVRADALFGAGFGMMSATVQFLPGAGPSVIPIVCGPTQGSIGGSAYASLAASPTATYNGTAALSGGMGGYANCWQWGEEDGTMTVGATKWTQGVAIPGSLDCSLSGNYTRDGGVSSEILATVVGNCDVNGTNVQTTVRISGSDTMVVDQNTNGLQWQTGQITAAFDAFGVVAGGCRFVYATWDLLLPGPGPGHGTANIDYSFCWDGVNAWQSTTPSCFLTNMPIGYSWTVAQCVVDGNHTPNLLINAAFNVTWGFQVLGVSQQAYCTASDTAQGTNGGTIEGQADCA
jgi:hypothetical protein